MHFHHYPLFFLLLFITGAASCAGNSETITTDNIIMSDSTLQTATFGAGCFWCVEAVFSDLKGVEAVEAGYTGGQTKNPSYKDVCSGKTGHAEVARITYDSDIVSYEDLLEVFWHTHDPTTLNRQGADMGTQYRSVIFYHNEEQRKIAEESKKRTEGSGLWDAPIVTQIETLPEYYKAEDYHQNYFVNNPSQPYCSAVIKPKVEKFRKQFKDKLKNSY